MTYADCLELQTLLSNYQEVIVNDKIVEQLQSRQGDLGANTRNLLKFGETYIFFIEQEIVTDSLEIDIKGLEKLAKASKNGIEKEPGQFVQKKDFPNLLGLFLNLGRDIEKAVKVAWEKLCNEKMPVLAWSFEDLRDHGIDGLGSTIDELEHKIKQLESFKSIDKIPKNETGLDEFEELAATTCELVKKVESKIGSPAVRSFLKQAKSQNGAKFEELTPEVKEWLEKSGQLKRIRLKL